MLVVSMHHYETLSWVFFPVLGIATQFKISRALWLWPHNAASGHTVHLLATQCCLWPHNVIFGHTMLPMATQCCPSLLATQHCPWPQYGPLGHTTLPLHGLWLWSTWPNNTVLGHTIKFWLPGVVPAQHTKSLHTTCQGWAHLLRQCSCQPNQAHRI